MKVNISFEGTLYENDNTIKTLIQSFDMLNAIEHAKNIIRLRLKHGDNISEQEEEILEEIREALFVYGLDI